MTEPPQPQAVTEAGDSPLRPAPDLGGGALSRFGKGAGYFKKALGFVLGDHPGLLGYCILPGLINFVLFVAALVLFWDLWPSVKGEFMQWMGTGHGWFVGWLIKILESLLWLVYVIMGLIVSFALVYLLGNLVSAPFNDILSERVEELYTGVPAPRFGLKRFFKSMWLAITEELKRLGFYLVVLLLIQLFNLLPVVGSAVSVILGGIFSAFFLALEYVSLPMARRFYKFQDWIGTVRRNLSLSLGFGTVSGALLWVPLLNFVVIPISVVSGTLLFCDMDRAGLVPPRPDVVREGGA